MAENYRDLLQKLKRLKKEYLDSNFENRQIIKTKIVGITKHLKVIESNVDSKATI